MVHQRYPQMSYVTCTSGAVMVKAGAKVASGMMLSGQAVARAIEHGESFVGASSRTDLITNYDNFPSDKKQVIEDAVSSHAAATLINYDMSNFTSRQEAVQMINFNWATRDAAINLLKQKEVSQDWIGGT